MITQILTCEIDSCGKCTFVSKNSAKENRADIFVILKKTNEKMKELGYPGASFSLVGSSKRTMIYIKSENDEQYDHDIQVGYASNKNPIKNHGDNLREDFINKLKEITSDDKYTWDFENSTRVITVKKSNDDGKVAIFDIALIDRINNTIHILDKQNIGGDKSIWNELGNINQAYYDANFLNKTDLKQEYLNKKHSYKNVPKSDPDYVTSSKLFIVVVNIIKDRNENN